jgi:hypothetical protein
LSTQTLAVDDMERRSDKDDDIVDSEAVAVRKIILASGLCRCVVVRASLLGCYRLLAVGCWQSLVFTTHRRPETGDRWVIMRAARRMTRMLMMCSHRRRSMPDFPSAAVTPAERFFFGTLLCTVTVLTVNTSVVIVVCSSQLFGNKRQPGPNDRRRSCQ